MAKKPLKMFKVNNISEVRDVDALYCIKTATDTEFSIVVTDAFGAIVNLKDLQTPTGIQGIASDDGTIEVTGTTFKNIRLSATLVNAINSALKAGDNISDLVNDVGYLTSFTEVDPIFQASEASNFVSGDKANLDNQSGVNTGDETSTSIQAKRPLKTVDNKSLEGTGNIEIDYNTVINKPTEFPPSTHTHTISEVINLQNELNSKENISNKVNTISGNSSTEYPTEKAVVDYVSSQIGADFAKVVYFDNVTPNVASIFDLNNPPLVNDPSLKEDVANLYIGTDASTWVYITSPAGYVTKTVTSSGSNFYITGTNTDAGSIKTGSITKKGQFVIDSGVIDDSGLTLEKTESSVLKTDSLGKVVKTTNLQDVEYAPIVHTHTVSQITDFPTFKTIENQSIIGAGNIDLDKASVGLENVDNTSDLNKIISTATQTALNAKANISGQVFTGAVSAPNLSGTNTGDNAPNSLYSGLVTNATHTGEVTGSTALTITNGAVTNAKLANVATSTLKGRVSATTGVVEDLTASQVRTLLNVANGANNYVHPANHPASIITQDASNRFVTDTEKSAWNAKESAIASGTISQYWRGDKTWQEFPTIQTIDNIPTDGSNNAVSSNGVFDALATKAPISSVHNPVTIGTANGLSLSTQQLSLGLASSGTTGALSGTDWNNFNSKFNTPTGLTTNYLPKWNGSGFGNSQIFDNGTNVGIGSTSIQLFGFGNFGGGVTSDLKLAVGNATYSNGFAEITNGSKLVFGYKNAFGSPNEMASIQMFAESISNNNESSSLRFFTKTGTNSVIVNEKMRITPSGRVLINKTDDDLTNQLQVAGTISASPATLPNQVVVKSQLDALASSGTYTPTTSNLINAVYANATSTSSYIKVGNIVFVSIRFGVKNTATGAVYFTVSLPINRTSTVQQSQIGVVNLDDGAGSGIVNFELGTNNSCRIFLTMPSRAGGDRVGVANFQYSVLE